MQDMVKEKLRIIPFYTGDETLEEALRNKKGLNMLWLAILLNDCISWELYLEVPEIRMAYDKACLWYGNFKTMIDGFTGRRPLELRRGKIDDREYRKFLEAINFVAGGA